MLNLKNIVCGCLNTLFSLEDYVQAVTLCRPAGHNAATGAFSAEEVTAECGMILLGYRPLELFNIPVAEQNEKLVIRAGELAGIIEPAPGDYLIEAVTGVRRNVVKAQIDRFGEFWNLHTVRSLDEDYGGLATLDRAEDWSDLALATHFDDRGTLS